MTVESATTPSGVTAVLVTLSSSGGSMYDWLKCEWIEYFLTECYFKYNRRQIVLKKKPTYITYMKLIVLVSIHFTNCTSGTNFRLYQTISVTWQCQSRGKFFRP